MMRVLLVTQFQDTQLQVTYKKGRGRCIVSCHEKPRVDLACRNSKIQEFKSVSHSIVSDSLWPHGQSMEFSRPEYWSGYHIPNKKINLLHLLKIKQSYNSLNRRLRTAITKSSWCQSLSNLGDYSPGKRYECLRIPSLYFLDFLCIFLKRSHIQIIFFSSVINTVSSTWSK